MMLAKCTATNKDGAPCNADAFKDGLCRWHTPDLAEQRQAWRAKGGAQRSNKNRAKKALPEGLKTMTEIQAILCITLGGVLSGRIEPGVGNSVANLARAIKDVAGSAELEERIAALESLTGRRAS